jgi:hypothetical protein
MQPSDQHENAEVSPPNTERRVEEKASGAWRLVWCAAAVPLGLAFVSPFVALFIRGSWRRDDWEVVAYVWGIIIAFLAVMRLMDAGNRRTEWFLTNDGLRRVLWSGRTQVIAWEQIQDMSWMGFLGLMIRWRRFGTEENGKVPYQQFNSLLCVGKPEADELIVRWREKQAAVPATEHRHKRAYRVMTDRSAGRDAGKLTVLGIIGLIGVVMGVCKKDWVITIGMGLLAAGSFTIAHWMMHGRKKSQAAALLAVLALAAIVVCLVLAQNKLAHGK